jgi:hypothetical protein
MMVINTPIGVFKSAPKDDSEAVMMKKLEDFPNNYPDGIKLYTDRGTIAAISNNVLTQSVLEIVRM